MLQFDCLGGQPTQEILLTRGNPRAQPQRGDTAKGKTQLASGRLKRPTHKGPGATPKSRQLRRRVQAGCQSLTAGSALPGLGLWLPGCGCKTRVRHPRSPGGAGLRLRAWLRHLLTWLPSRQPMGERGCEFRMWWRQSEVDGRRCFRPGGPGARSAVRGQFRWTLGCEEGSSCGRSGGQGIVVDVPAGGGPPGPFQQRTHPRPLAFPKSLGQRGGLQVCWCGSERSWSLFFSNEDPSAVLSSVAKNRLCSRPDQVSFSAPLPDPRFPMIQFPFLFNKWRAELPAL